MLREYPHERTHIYKSQHVQHNQYILPCPESLFLLHAWSDRVEKFAQRNVLRRALRPGEGKEQCGWARPVRAALSLLPAEPVFLRALVIMVTVAQELSDLST